MVERILHEATTIGYQNAIALLVFASFSLQQRREIFKRSQGECEFQDCKKKAHEGWLMHCHHKKPLHWGGENETTNGIMLCVHCHYLAHYLLWLAFGKKEDEWAYKSLKNSNQKKRRY